jgi:hypothetical protein
MRFSSAHWLTVIDRGGFNSVIISVSHGAYSIPAVSGKDFGGKIAQLLFDMYPYVGVRKPERRAFGHLQHSGLEFDEPRRPLAFDFLDGDEFAPFPVKLDLTQGGLGLPLLRLSL